MVAKHAVVFRKNGVPDEKDREWYANTWSFLTDGDYIVHALYVKDDFKSCIALIDDNVHSNIEDCISTFIHGAEFALHETIKEQLICVVVGDDEDPYDAELVCKYIEMGEYYEVSDI